MPDTRSCPGQLGLNRPCPGTFDARVSDQHQWCSEGAHRLSRTGRGWVLEAPFQAASDPDGAPPQE